MISSMGMVAVARHDLKLIGHFGEAHIEDRLRMQVEFDLKAGGAKRTEHAASIVGDPGSSWPGSNPCMALTVPSCAARETPSPESPVNAREPN